jgi:hypothetical protein
MTSSCLCIYCWIRFSSEYVWNIWTGNLQETINKINLHDKRSPTLKDCDTFQSRIHHTHHNIILSFKVWITKGFTTMFIMLSICENHSILSTFGFWYIVWFINFKKMARIVILSNHESIYGPSAFLFITRHSTKSPVHNHK